MGFKSERTRVKGAPSYSSFLLFSGSVHVGLVVAAWLMGGEFFWQIESSPTRVTYIHIPMMAQKGVETGAGGTRYAKGAGRTIRLKLSDLAPRSKEDRAFVKENNGQEGGYLEDFAEGFDGSDVLKRPKEDSILLWIARRVDESLEYPIDLFRRSIDGTVFLKIHFLNNGRLDRVVSRSSSSHLRVYGHRTLERIFSGSEIPSQIWGRRKDALVVDLKLEFGMLPHSMEVLRQHRYRWMGRSLVVYRHRGNLSDRWKLAPLANKYGAYGVQWYWIGALPSDKNTKSPLLLWIEADPLFREPIGY